MHELRPYIDRIEVLLEAEDERSQVYAALEARMGIEHACYERLRIAHDYISNEELAVWQPPKLMKRLILDVNEHAASEMTVYISREPIKAGDERKSAADYAEDEWIKVGTQTSFDAKKLSRLWHALGAFLHVKVPKTKHDDIGRLPDADVIRRTIREVVDELGKLAEGTLLSSGFGNEFTFECGCGHKNRRREALLKTGDLIHCINPECQEEFDVGKEGESFTFARRTVDIVCTGCGLENTQPEWKFRKIEPFSYFELKCARCGLSDRYAMMPVQYRPPSDNGS